MVLDFHFETEHCYILYRYINILLIVEKYPIVYFDLYVKI